MLAGKTVLITGAARGIGAECARRLAGSGARVSLVGLEPEELARVAADCGPDAAWFEADVADWAALERAASGTVERFGGIDVLIANAGIAPVGAVRSIDPRAFERTIEVNLLGTWRTARTCLPHLIERRGYALIVASLAAIVQLPGMAPYAASKAGIEAFGNSLRLEVAHLDVDVGVAYFSWLETDLVTGGQEHPAFALLRKRLRGPTGKTYPVSIGVDAVVRGIEKRARHVVAPGWVRWLLPFRGLITPLSDRNIRDSVPEMDAMLQAEVERRGPAEASAPVGAGGAAAVEAAKD